MKSGFSRKPTLTKSVDMCTFRARIEVLPEVGDDDLGGRHCRFSSVKAASATSQLGREFEAM